MFAYNREPIACPQVEKDLSDQSGIASPEVRHETSIDIPSGSADACRARLRLPGRCAARESDRRISRGIARRPSSDRIEQPIGWRPGSDRIEQPIGWRPGDRIERPIGWRPRSDRIQQPVGWQPIGERRNRARVRIGPDRRRCSDWA
jgi:hypothetical protein